jgi:hypothetical protein
MTQMKFKFQNRKVQKSMYTHWITLPPEWLVNQGIGRGDEVCVEMMEDHTLRIAPAHPAKNDAGAATTSPKPEVA